MKRRRDVLKPSGGTPTRFMENVDGMPNTTQNYELVYAIQSKNLKHVKIGYTTDINQRLSSLQGGSSDELRIIGCWLGAVQDERRLHEQLRRWRIHREWFQDSEDVRPQHLVQASN